MEYKLTIHNINGTLLVEGKEVAYILGKTSSNFSKSISKYINYLKAEKYNFKDYFRGRNYNPKIGRYSDYLITLKGCDFIAKKIRFNETFKKIYKRDFEEYIFKSNLISITTIAKELGISNIKLNKLLEEYNVQYKEDDIWYIERNYKFLLNEKFADYQDNQYKNWKKTLKWTEKGRQWIIDFLKQNNVTNTV